MIVRCWYLQGLQQHQEGLWVPLSPAKRIDVVSTKNSGPFGLGKLDLETILLSHVLFAMDRRTRPSYLYLIGFLPPKEAFFFSPKFPVPASFLAFHFSFFHQLKIQSLMRVVWGSHRLLKMCRNGHLEVLKGNEENCSLPRSNG